VEAVLTLLAGPALALFPKRWIDAELIDFLYFFGAQLVELQ